MRSVFYVVMALGVYGGYVFLAVELFERGHVALGLIIAFSLLMPVVALVAIVALSFLAFATWRAAVRSVE